MAIVSVRQLVKVFVFDNMSVFIKATLSSFHCLLFMLSQLGHLVFKSAPESRKYQLSVNSACLLTEVVSVIS